MGDGPFKIKPRLLFLSSSLLSRQWVSFEAAPAESLPEQPMNVAEEGRAAAELPEQPVSVGGGAHVGTGKGFAAGLSKPVTVQPSESLPETPTSMAEEARWAAELPDKPMSVGGGARVGAGTALAAAPSKPVTARRSECQPKPPISVAEEERAAA
mmetsp:Transcript_55195/g.125498  ORF Transcript_55195/g.125498 Transcript_55195/m.125498 type:complete len:155 (-) Transcript_55195:40-504(-)